MKLVTILADTGYNNSTYGSGLYGGHTSASPAPLLQLGPLTLPNTGAGWAVIVGAVVIAIAVAWWMMLLSHRRKQI